MVYGELVQFLFEPDVQLNTDCFTKSKLLNELLVLDAVTSFVNIDDNKRR